MKKSNKRKKIIKKSDKKIFKRSFTLLELIIVIAILVVLSATVAVGFISSMKKGRDARRKIDLAQIKGALENYYEDNLRYPPSPLGDELCDPGPDGCTTKRYMSELPVDPKTKISYFYETNPEGNYYKLYADLENTQDVSGGYNPGGYVGTDCNSDGTCNYGISSTNVTLAPTSLTPAPSNSPAPTTEPTDVPVTLAPTTPPACTGGAICCNTDRYACCGTMGDVCYYNPHTEETSHCCTGVCSSTGCVPTREPCIPKPGQVCPPPDPNPFL